jgi:hypothetical protein
VVDVEPVDPDRVDAGEVGRGRVGAFQVSGPVTGAGGDLVVESTECGLAGTAGRVDDDRDEVAVAVGVAVTERERTLQVGADEVGVEDVAPGRSGRRARR